MQSAGLGGDAARPSRALPVAGWRRAGRPFWRWGGGGASSWRGTEGRCCDSGAAPSRSAARRPARQGGRQGGREEGGKGRRMGRKGAATTPEPLGLENRALSWLGWGGPRAGAAPKGAAATQEPRPLDPLRAPRRPCRAAKEPPMATMASHSGRARSKRVRRPGPEQGGTGGNPENAITNLPPGCVRGGEER